MMGGQGASRPELGRRRLLGGVFAAALLGCAPLRAETPAAPIAISATEAFELAALGEVVLIDVRTPPEWRESGVAQPAVAADMTASDFGAQLFAALDGDKSRPVALICATGRRSARVAQALAEAGFTAVYDVSEGMHGSVQGPGWLARELPTRAAP